MDVKLIVTYSDSPLNNEKIKDLGNNSELDNLSGVFHREFTPDEANSSHIIMIQ